MCDLKTILLLSYNFLHTHLTFLLFFTTGKAHKMGTEIQMENCNLKLCMKF